MVLKGTYAQNKYRYQKQEIQRNEFADGSGLETYEFKYRMDDQQIGRFWAIDPLANKYVYDSTYAFSENKVTSNVELEGLEAGGLGYGVGWAWDKKIEKGWEEGWKATSEAGLQGVPKVVIMGILVVDPQAGIPLAIAYLSGVPVTPAPQAMSSFSTTAVVAG